MPKRTTSTTRRRTGDSSKSTVVGLLLIVSVALIFAFSGWYYLKNKEDLDKFGCPNDLALRKNISVIVVDTSSQFNADQKQALNGFSDKILNSIPKYTELKLYKMTDSGVSNKDLLLSVCSPGDPKEVNQWTQNQKIAMQNWKIGFAKKIDEEFKSISNSQGLNKSPIIESIRSVSLLEFGGDNQKSKSLIVISDFVQNSKILNMYSTAVDFNTFKSSPEYAESISRLVGVKTELLILENEPKIQNDKFKDFWKQFILVNGGAPRMQSLIQF
jgi:hypothetical protein